VTATNVTIDLNGFSLTAAGINSTANGIISMGSGLTLRNGTIAGWFNGALSFSSKNKIENGLFSSGSASGGGLNLDDVSSILGSTFNVLVVTP